MGGFEEAFARTVYQYGEDALEQVRLGWDLRGEQEATEIPIAPNGEPEVVSFGVQEYQMVPPVHKDSFDPGYWNFLQTFTGKKFFPLAPEKYEIDIRDLAHGCALENRYGGQTDVPYSVAQHCILVAEILSTRLGRPDLAFEGLMHDAAEGLIKDLPRDIKVALGDAYKKRIEEPFEHLIAKRFGLVYPWPAEVKVADGIALMTERRDLFSRRNPDWVQQVEPMEEKVTPWGWAEAEWRFLREFEMLARCSRGGRSR